MQKSQQNPYDAVVAMIPPLVQKARDLGSMFTTVIEGRGGQVVDSGFGSGQRAVID